MSKILGISLAIFLTMILVACKQNAKATIYNDKAEVLKVIDEKSAVAEIVQAWKVKERALEKLMPLFEYKIEMEVDGETQMWRFNKAGYLMKEGESVLYKTSKKDVFIKHLD